MIAVVGWICVQLSWHQLVRALASLPRETLFDQLRDQYIHGFLLLYLPLFRVGGAYGTELTGRLGGSLWIMDIATRISGRTEKRGAGGGKPFYLRRVPGDASHKTDISYHLVL